MSQPTSPAQPDSSSQPTSPAPDFEVGQLIEVTPERPAHGGTFVARVEGRVVFVRHAVVGERATARITGRGPKGRYFLADVVATSAPSQARRPHPWPAADSLKQETPLGGMEYGHLDPVIQRHYKQQIVAEQLARLGGVPASHPMLTDLPVHTVPGANGEVLDTGWRTRVHYAVERTSGQIAMFPPASSVPVPVQDFPLADPRLAGLGLHRLRLKDVTRLDAAVSATGMVALVFTVSHRSTPAEVAPRLEEQCRQLWGNLEEQMVSLLFTAEKKGGRRRGTKPADVLVGSRDLLETATVYAQDYYWMVDATGFWQIHRGAPEALGNAVLDMARVRKGQTVYDLYAGAGLFSAILADAVGLRGRVLSVEGSPVTHRNASENLGEDGMARTHRSERTAVRCERGDVGQVLAGIATEVAHGDFPAPDVVVLDPSREGCGREVMGQVSALEPQTIIYVACDPAALGRDTGYLRELGWKLMRVEAFDMYPNTHHVEAVAVFTPANRT